MEKTSVIVDKETIAEIEKIIQSEKGYEYAKFLKYIKESFFLILVFFIGLFILFKIEFPPDNPNWYNKSEFLLMLSK